MRSGDFTIASFGCLLLSDNQNIEQYRGDVALVKLLKLIDSTN